MGNFILIVDDEPNVIASLKRALMDEPYEVITACNGTEGLEQLEKHRIKVVMSDEMMPGMSGTEFLTEVKKRRPETIRIMLTGHASIEAAMNAVNRGEIYRFFTKPWNDIEIKLALKSAIERYDLEEENRRLLRTVRRQAVNLKLLEKAYPSITRLDRDEEGNILIPDMDDDEFRAIVAQCEQEYA